MGRGGWLEGAASWARRWLFTTDSTRTGIVWLVVTFFIFFWAGFLALQMRLELAWPGEHHAGPQHYAELFTLHGTFMAFFVAVPIFFGFGSIILPRALGTSNMAFPRMNNLDLWLIFAGSLTLEIGYVFGERPAAGWTGYPPLSLDAFQPGRGMDWWVWAIFMETLGTVLAGVNVLATVVKSRRGGLRMSRMPVFVWSMLFASLLVIVAGPFLLTALAFLFLDRNFGTMFFLVEDARALLLWQDLFWFYSHPATYVMLLPALGIVSAIIARFSGRLIFSYRMIVVGMAGIWIFSYLVWWHHMFTTGMNAFSRVFASFATMGVSVFSGIVVFAWLASLWRGRLRLTTPMLWALGVIAMFTVGGADGVFMAFIPLDLYLHDTYWLVAHFHYIIFGATILGAFAGIYYWFPDVFGRRLSEPLGKWHFWLTLVGMNVTFFPMHLLGLAGMPRRVWDYGPELALTNLVISLGALLLAAAQLLFVYNIVRTLRAAPASADASWGAASLNVAGPMLMDAEDAPADEEVVQA